LIKMFITLHKQKHICSQAWHYKSDVDDTRTHGNYQYECPYFTTK